MCNYRINELSDRQSINFESMQDLREIQLRIHDKLQAKKPDLLPIENFIKLPNKSVKI